jgi:hypothetical protein
MQAQRHEAALATKIQSSRSKRAMNCKKRPQCVWRCAPVSQVWKWRQGSHAINGYTLRGDYLISVLSLKPEMCWLQ